ncbi:hypothetical protein FXO38_14759 [Capsicum annuum]|nr:hypothetical protein FXO38_14759 [Capsicum annuum]KAF3666706.1 hypothetical protein FXO37_10386 [Capsicum annuum]
MEEVGVGMVMEEEEWRRWLVVVHMVGGIVAVKEGEREVATLSRLQHQHVVRYYQAWYETGITVSCDDSSCGSRTVVSSSFTFVDGRPDPGPDPDTRPSDPTSALEPGPDGVRRMGRGTESEPRSGLGIGSQVEVKFWVLCFGSGLRVESQESGVILESQESGVILVVSSQS